MATRKKASVARRSSAARRRSSKAPSKAKAAPRAKPPAGAVKRGRGATQGSARAARSTAKAGTAPAPGEHLEPVQMDAAQIAAVLQEIAALLELTGENPFKVRAYENAARVLPGVGDELPELIRNARLHTVRGIGKGIAEKITALACTGKLEYYDELRAKLPAGLLEMLRVPGLGPKKIKMLYDTLGIAGIPQLEKACEAGALAELKGFGTKTEQNILAAIAHYRRIHTRFLWKVAHAEAAPILAALRERPEVVRAEIAGSLRRRRETVKDVDFVVSTSDPQDVSAWFAAAEWVERVIGSGTTKTSILHRSGIQMDLRVVDDAQFPYALHHFTGSKAHNVAMRGRAQRMGYKINEYGLFHGDTLVPCKSEADLFEALGLEYIPPELREDLGEIDAAEHGRLPKRLLEDVDVRGVFHVHTDRGRGRDDLKSLVRAAQADGWAYLGISDVTRGVDAEHGLDAAAFEAQRRELQALRRSSPVKVLHGVECAIRKDGRLDLPEEERARFDFVIATVHEHFDLDRDRQTKRLLRALDQPYVTILGSPTGRVIDRRPAMEFDLAAVLERAAEREVAVEINARPERSDLDGAGAKQARDRGALVCIGVDARGAADLEDVHLGVGLARRGWCEVRHVLNTRDARTLKRTWQERRKQAAGSGR